MQYGDEGADSVDTQRHGERSIGSVLEALRGRLHEQAHLFDDPAAYVAGVEDTLSALAPLLRVAEPVGDHAIARPRPVAV